MVRTTLTKRAADFHIDLDDVAITDLKFGKDFTAAIESKQVAEQDAERAKFMVLKAEQEKQAQLLRAEGLVAAEETPPLLRAVPRRPPSSRRRASPRRLASSRRRWRTRPPSSSCAASRRKDTRRHHPPPATTFPPPSPPLRHLPPSATSLPRHRPAAAPPHPQAAKDIAETLARSRNVTYLPCGGAGGGQNLLLNVGAGGQ